MAENESGQYGDVPDNERDEERDFGNEQSMSVHDKLHPALGPTEEAQDVATLQQQVVPMPAFNDPHNPIAAAGSVNLSLEDHPVTHSADYGRPVIESLGHDHVEHTMSEGARDLKQFDLSGADNEQRAAVMFADLPADRGDWQKKDWQSAARAYGLGTSGNIGAVQKRVEEHEAQREEYDNFARELRSASREELDEMASERNINPEDYSSKDLLAQAIIAAETDEPVPAGDRASDDDDES